jgi:hypothetical protein
MTPRIQKAFQLLCSIATLCETSWQGPFKGRKTFHKAVPLICHQRNACRHILKESARLWLTKTTTIHHRQP